MFKTRTIIAAVLVAITLTVRHVQAGCSDAHYFKGHIAAHCVDEVTQYPSQYVDSANTLSVNERLGSIENLLPIIYNYHHTSAHPHDSKFLEKNLSEEKRVRFWNGNRSKEEARAICTNYGANGNLCVSWSYARYNAATNAQIQAVSKKCWSNCESIGNSCATKDVDGNTLQFYCYSNSPTTCSATSLMRGR